VASRRSAHRIEPHQRSAAHQHRGHRAVRATAEGHRLARLAAAGRYHEAAWLGTALDDHSAVRILRIDERQLLEALLIPSADNAADYLARWDAGSIVAFAAKMNAEARALGLTGTHYADASGFNSRSVSTPRDQAVVAALAMRNPVFRAIVDNSSLVLPTGRVWNYNPAVGVDGIVGVKSGFTQAAQACLVTAAWRTVGGHRLLVIAATLGQPLGLGYAAQVDEALTQAASAALVSRTVVAAGAVVGKAVAGSGGSASLRLSGDPLALAGWPGLVVRPVVVPVRLHGSSLPAGATVALLEFACPGGAVEASTELVLDRALLLVARGGQH
jgi:D-alanyl-D-alanine carboxypeptidase (penicillin-binding protein 5/6)